MRTPISPHDRAIGVPPRVGIPPEIKLVGGRPSVNGTPLQDFGQKAVDVVMGPLTGGKPLNEAQANYTPGQYGNALTIPIVFGAAGEVIALRRPSNTRVSLLIQNLTVVGNIHYCFDRQADNATCIAIAAGGNRLFDTAVAQGDLHIFSTGAGTVIIEFMNQDIQNPANV